MKKTQDLPLFNEFCILFKSFSINSWTKSDFIQNLSIIGVEKSSLNHFHVISLIIRLIIEEVLIIDDSPEREIRTTYSESNKANSFRDKYC